MLVRREAWTVVTKIRKGRRVGRRIRAERKRIGETQVSEPQDEPQIRLHSLHREEGGCYRLAPALPGHLGNGSAPKLPWTSIQRPPCLT